MITPATFKFLSSLARHNDRAWFNDHKTDYEAARGEFEALVGELILAVSSFDRSLSGLDPRKCVFRIYRDTRFSKDKTPYKTHFGAHLVSAGKGPGGSAQERAGYYVHVQPGESMLGGGAHMPSPQWLRAIRSAIDRDGKQLKKIAAAPAFKKYFGALEGEALKTAPKGYAPDHPHIDLLKQKSLVAVHELKDKEVLAPGFTKQAATLFKAMKPFTDFLNGALERD